MFHPSVSDGYESGITHIRENSDDTQRHLDENRSKYETDGNFLLRLMKMGKRLTRQQVVSEYKINDRRLGELHSEGKCKKEWKLSPAGKRLFVEYFCDPPPKPPTKKETISNWGKLFEGAKQSQLF